MEIIVVAAYAANRIIGGHGHMPWHVPEDLRHFRSLTLGSPIIMGRRTWESLGGALEGRTNIVLSRNPTYVAEGAVVASSTKAAIERAKATGATRTFIIGGGEVFDEAIHIADRLVLTELDLQVAGDTHFPSVDERAWQIVSQQRHVSQTGVHFVIKELVRVRAATSGG